jgi:hypothetical protein
MRVEEVRMRVAENAGVRVESALVRVIDGAGVRVEGVSWVLLCLCIMQ